MLFEYYNAVLFLKGDESQGLSNKRKVFMLSEQRISAQSVTAAKVNGIFLRKGNDKVTLAKYSQMRIYRVRQITSGKRYVS